MSAKRPAPPTRRVNHGRGHSYLIDGTKAPGVTTLLGGIPKPALVGWAAAAVGDFVADRLQLVDGHVHADEVLDDLRHTARWPIPDFRELKKIPRTKVADAFKGLPYAERDAAANRGTEVHRLAQRLAEGEEVTVPDELVGHVDSYLKFRADWQPFDEQVEFIVLNRTCGYMGTGDLICRLRAAPGMGLCLVDLKTNRSGPFGETGLQLAGYRYAEFLVDPDGLEEPMPQIDSTLALWLRADGYDLYPFEAGPAQHRMLLYAGQVADFVAAQGPEDKRPPWARSTRTKGEALTPPRKAIDS